MRFLAAIVIAGSLSATSSVLADAAADFSPAANPNVVWSYGYRNNLAAPFNLYTRAINIGGIDYWDANFAGTPYASHNGTAAPILGGAPPVGTTRWNPGDLVVRPGVNAQITVVRWTCPAAGNYNVNVNFDSADIAAGTRDVYVRVNGVIAFAGFLAGPIPATVPFNANFALLFGDTIEFEVGFGGDNYLNDAVRLGNASVSPANCPGDSDGNGQVNFQDITTSLSNFGRICP